MASRLLLISLGIGCAACSAMPWNSARNSPRDSHPQEVDRELVAAVPPAQRQGIDEARSSRDEAADAFDVAQRNRALAEDQLVLAHKELGVARAEQEAAQTAAVMAEKGSTEDLETAKEALDEAETVVTSAENRIKWREMDLECARKREELAQRKVVLADARVELARAEAVKELDRPAARDVNIDEYQRMVRDQERAVAMAEIDVDAAENEVSIAHDKYMSSANAIPASSVRRTESIDEDIDFESDGYEARPIDQENQK